MLRLIIIYILFNSLISVWILNIYKDDMLISNFNVCMNEVKIYIFSMYINDCMSCFVIVCC